MKLNQVLRMLSARRWPMLIVFAAVLGASVAVVSILPKQYTATATVLVDVKSPDPMNGMVLPAMLSQAYMATQVDVIRSERVALSVIRTLRLNENPQIRENWLSETDGKGQFEAWLAAALQKNLDVKPSRDSSVISIEYQGASPELASALANAFVKAYLDVSLQLRTDPAKQYSELFDTQSKVFKDRLEAAQAKLSDYQNKNGLLATDQRMDIENSRLLELSSQLVALQAQRAESESRKRNSSQNSPEVLQNGLIGQLKADLSRQESRLKELATRLGQAHPTVAEQQASVNDLRNRVAEETARISGSVGIQDNVVRYREAQVKQALDEQRAKVMKLNAQRDVAQVLVRDVESAQKAYDAVIARMNQTLMESQSNSTNLMLLKAATPPAKHSFPKYTLTLVMASVLGMLLSVTVALVWELFAKRIRGAEDIQETGLVFVGAMGDASKLIKRASVEGPAANHLNSLLRIGS